MNDTLTELRAWLTRDVHDPVDVWEREPAPDALQCRPDLVARLAEIARPVGAVRRVFVGGRPVIHHPNGMPIAAASGTASLTVRSARSAGALATYEVWLDGLGPEWTMLDPWAPDVALSRTIDLLRGHIAHAYTLAERAA
jgi:hypothetical protein